MNKRSLIEETWEKRELLNENSHREAILETLDQLDKGSLRVAEPQGDEWIVHEWIKKAVLLYFGIVSNKKIEAGQLGSCAQIGKNVHLSGGVGIGGVLEPLQAAPVIIEDNAFIGSRSIVVEGVRVGKEAVLGANVVLTASTKILKDMFLIEVLLFRAPIRKNFRQVNMVYLAP